jgi:hypothetical protein
MESQPWEQYAESHALSRAGTKDLIWGFIVLGIGAGITLGTWAATEPGGSYWVMWGLIGTGLFGIIRGLYRKVKSGAVLGIRGRWAAASIAILGSMAGLGLFTYQNLYPSDGYYDIENTPTPPSDSYFVGTDNSYWQDEWNSVLHVQGTVENTHHAWSIEQVEVIVEATDEHGSTMKQYRVTVTPYSIPPGGEAYYSKTLQLPYECAGANFGWEWYWVPP